MALVITGVTVFAAGAFFSTIKVAIGEQLEKRC